MRIFYPIGASLLLVIMLLQIPPITSRHYDELEPVYKDLYRYDDDWEDNNDGEVASTRDEIIIKRETEGSCPEWFPYAYKGGEYCCKYAYEKNFGKEGCNGGPISLESVCCKSNKFQKCKYSVCKDFEIGTCPQSYPYAYSDGELCCKFGYENDSGKQTCDGGPISMDSTCCLNNKKTECSYSKCKSFESNDATKALFEELKQKVVDRMEGLTTKDSIKQYLESDDSLEVFQYEFLNKMVGSQKNFTLEDEAVTWIFNNKTMMDKLMTSGDVPSDNYGKAIEILAEIIKQDPNAMDGWKLNLAIGIAIVFTEAIKSWAYGWYFDAIERYNTFAKWGDEKVYFDLFYTLNAWEMRYLAISKVTDDEMIWARENVPDANKNPWNVAGSTHKMVRYTSKNAEGVGVGDPAFYDYKPRTMEVLHQYGAVCGGISKFGTGMANAFGIPAFMVGQPGHGAFLWLKNGTEWSIGNNVGGWWVARVGVPFTWRKEAPFFPLMHEAQKTPEAYRLSEKMRIISNFVDPALKFEILDAALAVCPQNYDVYMELKETMSQDNFIDEKYIENQMMPYLESYYNSVFGFEKDVALNKAATASEGTPSSALDQSAGTVWKCTAETAWLEIDLGHPCDIRSIEMRWWGWSTSADYDILAQIDGVFHTVLTRSDEDRQTKKNAIGYLPGWDGKTTNIRFEFRKGNTVKANSFALKDIIVTGVEHMSTEKISLGRPVTTNLEDNTGEKLVDGDLETYWTSNVEDSTILIEFKGLCVVESVLIDWVDDIQGLQTVQYLFGDDIVHDSSETGAYERIEMNGFGGSLKIKLEGANFYSIREVTAVGACVSTNTLLKERLSSTLAVPITQAASFLLDNIGSVIDEYKCDSCW